MFDIRLELQQILYLMPELLELRQILVDVGNNNRLLPRCRIPSVNLKMQ